MISFGPVPSRRLGKSLGINNIVSPKVCSYGCIYCQVGRTIKKSIIRNAFYPPGIIYKDVVQHIKLLSPDNYPDYLTIVSNGEPTLDINLGKIIKQLKKIGPPIAVITNASLLADKYVKNDLHLADWVSLKVDTAKIDTWHLINRPADGLDFDRIVEHLTLFSGEYQGRLCTESMILDSVNNSEEDLVILAEIIKKINPWKAYLSVPIRPPAEKWVKPPDIEKLNRAWQILDSMHIRTELLAGFEGSETGFTGNIYEDILNITAVHPLREDSLLKLLYKNKADWVVVESLIAQRLIRSTIYNGKRFFLREYHA
jgi:wyosine [tRNA(Phe)-imidazoG37] synthetase (radical SAM superfamily)